MVIGPYDFRIAAHAGHIGAALVTYNEREFRSVLGARDKTIVEFKLAKNHQLERNLRRQAEIYSKASDAQNVIKVIFYFSNEEFRKVNVILKRVGLLGHRDVVLIDARRDNKPSGSKA